MFYCDKFHKTKTKIVDIHTNTFFCHVFSNQNLQNFSRLTANYLSESLSIRANFMSRRIGFYGIEEDKNGFDKKESTLEGLVFSNTQIFFFLVIVRFIFIL